MIAKCPKCDRSPSSIRYDAIDLKKAGSDTWKGVVFSCPSCDTILSVGVDFVALKGVIVNEVLAGSRGR